MKKTVKTLMSALCVVAMLGSMTLLIACQQDPAIIEPVDSTPTRTTLALPKEQMTLNDIMALNAASMEWTTLKPYTHTDNGDGTASFKVADTYGEEADLLVTYDADANSIVKAELSYEGLTASILTDDDFVILPIMQAMLAKNNIE